MNNCMTNISSHHKGINAVKEIKRTRNFLKNKLEIPV